MSIGRCLDLRRLTSRCSHGQGSCTIFHTDGEDRGSLVRLSPTLQGHDTIDPHGNSAYGEESVLEQASESHLRRDVVRNTDATGTAARRRGESDR